MLDLAWPGAVMLGNRYVSTSLPPRTATQVRRSTILQSTTTPQGDGQPETVGRRSATASFRHCCLIKWLSGNASLGFSRYWAGGGLYSTFGHQFALRRRKSSRRGRVYPAAMSAAGRLTDQRSAHQQHVCRRCLQLGMRSVVRVGERLLCLNRIDMRRNNHNGG